MLRPLLWNPVRNISSRRPPSLSPAFKCNGLRVPEGTSPGNLAALATDKNSTDSFLATAAEPLDEAPMTGCISLATNNFSSVVK